METKIEGVSKSSPEDNLGVVNKQDTALSILPESPRETTRDKRHEQAKDLSKGMMLASSSCSCVEEEKLDGLALEAKSRSSSKRASVTSGGSLFNPSGDCP